MCCEGLVARWQLVIRDAKGKSNGIAYTSKEFAKLKAIIPKLIFARKKERKVRPPSS